MGGGDHRDRLALVANLVEGQHGLVGDLHAVGLGPRHVNVGQDGDDAVEPLGGRRVDPEDTGSRVGAPQRDTPERSIEELVRGEDKTAVDL